MDSQHIHELNEIVHNIQLPVRYQYTRNNVLKAAPTEIDNEWLKQIPDY